MSAAGAWVVLIGLAFGWFIWAGVFVCLLVPGWMPRRTEEVQATDAFSGPIPAPFGMIDLGRPHHRAYRVAIPMGVFAEIEREFDALTVDTVWVCVLLGSSWLECRGEPIPESWREIVNNRNRHHYCPVDKRRYFGQQGTEFTFGSGNRTLWQLVARKREEAEARTKAERAKREAEAREVETAALVEELWRNDAARRLDEI
jgi:hypothetical protein